MFIPRRNLISFFQIIFKNLIQDYQITTQTVQKNKAELVTWNEIQNLKSTGIGKSAKDMQQNLKQTEKMKIQIVKKRITKKRWIQDLQNERRIPNKDVK